MSDRASSKMHLLLAEAEILSHGGSASVLTYLRRCKKLLHSSIWERGVRMKQTALQPPRSVQEAGRAPGAGADSPAACGEAHERLAVPSAHGS